MRYTLRLLLLLALFCPVGGAAGAAAAGHSAPVPAMRTPPPTLVLYREVVIPESDTRIERRDGVDLLSLRGGVHSAEPGLPALPILPLSVPLPAGTVMRAVRVRVAEADTLPGACRLAAVPPPGPPGAVAPPAAPVVALWSGRYPAVVAKAGPIGYRRGQALGAVLVTPFQYDADSQRLIVLRRLELEIDLAADSPPAEEAPLLPLRRTSLTIPGGEPFQPSFRPSLDGTPVAYVIITDDAQAAAYQQLADWKTQSGVPAVVRTVAWIRANYPNGVDTQETIRNFIRDAVQKWGTEWVLLGGDTPVVPIRYAHSTYYVGDDIPTDLYYQCLDGTWNADGDAIFGEASNSQTDPGDACDFYPDVFIGRLPTNTPAEAQAVINKTLAYARAPERTGYLTRSLSLGEVLFPASYHPGDSIVLDGASLCETAIALLPSGWQSTRLYENCPAVSAPDCIFETKAVVVDSLNAGFGVVHHVGHGFTNTMSVGDQGLTLSNADAAALHNGARTFLLYAINCTSSAIDYSCIAERFILNPGGGAVASVGSTRLDFPFSGWNYQDEFYRLLFQENWTELARCADGSRDPFVPVASFEGGYRWTMFSEIVLGDPQLSIWTAEPADLQVTAPTTFTLGGAPPVVTVLAGGVPVDSARVCFNKPGDDYVVALTDAAGQASLPFSPDLVGAFTLTVMARNAIPWTGTGIAILPAQPHLFVAGVSVRDDGTGASIGNGDGRADAGETIELLVTLRNGGGATVDSVLATLSTGGAGLPILDSQSLYPPLAGGGSAAPLDPIVIRVGPARPDRTEASLHLGLVSGVATFADDFILPLHAPVLDWYGMSFSDSTAGGDDDELVEPGEPILLLPRLRNLGTGTSDQAWARLSSTDPVFVLADSLVAFGTLPGGSSTPAAPADGFRFTMTDTTGLAAAAHRLLVSVYDSRHVTTPLFTWSIAPPGRPAAPLNLLATGAPGSIKLTFSPVAHPRLRGYNIYRAPSASGPFTRINPNVTERTTYYNDEGLTPYVVYHYKAAAQDSSGYEGPLSVGGSASTTLPPHAGFPVATGGAANGSITLANLDHDAALEIVGAGEEVYALNADGTELVDGDNDPATVGALGDTGGPSYWNAPAVGDVDRDGSPDIAAVSWTGSLYLWSNQGVVKPGFPRNVNLLNMNAPNPLGSVAMADVAGDPRLELFCFVGANIFAFRGDGTELLDGDGNPATIGLFKSTAVGFSYGTPALADLNGDGRAEIICGMRDSKLHVFQATSSTVELPGFPVTTGGNITASPAVGDLDGDSQPDIVCGSSDGKMHALKSDGAPVAGWPQNIQLQQDLDSSPALGDLTGDGRPDVVCGASNGRVFAWRHDGVALPGFPVEIRDRQGAFVALRSSPILVDIDSDGTPEILIADQIGRLFAFRAGGQLVVGFPVQTENKIDGAPAAWDLDGDGLTEVVVQSFDQKIWHWDTPWTFNPLASPWPMFHHDARHTGNLAEAPDPQSAVGEERQPMAPTALLQPNTPNPFQRATTIRFELAPRVSGAARPEPVRIEIFSAAGRRMRVLVDRPLPAGHYSVEWDGTDGEGRRVAAGHYYCRLATPSGTQARKMVLLRG